MKRNVYTLLYSVVLGGICAVVPTTVGEYTAPYREANAKAEEIRNILQVLEIPFSPASASRDLVGLFEKTVQSTTLGNLSMYVSKESSGSPGRTAAALPFSGPGIWGTIRGFLSLEMDMATIRRISFYQNEETPGLGGEINTSWFTDKFKGKSIRNSAGAAGFVIRRSGAQGPNEIDGISGATLTCGKVQTILNTLIRQIDKEKQHEK